MSPSSLGRAADRGWRRPIRQGRVSRDIMGFATTPAATCLAGRGSGDPIKRGHGAFLAPVSGTGAGDGIRTRDNLLGSKVIAGSLYSLTPPGQPCRQVLPGIVHQTKRL